MSKKKIFLRNNIISIPTANIISAWKFDSNYLDSIGSNNGTGYSTSIVSSGGIGNVVEFTRASSSIITIPDADSLSFGNSISDVAFSVSVRVKFKNVSVNQLIFNKQGSSSINREYQLLFTSSANILRFRLYTDLNNRIDCDFPWSPSIGVWYDIVATYNGSGNSSGLKLYLNGKLLTTSNYETGTYTAMKNTSEPLYIGKYIPDNLFTLDGYLDELYFFDKELSQRESFDIFRKHLKNIPLV